jgi:hypothetical protein
MAAGPFVTIADVIVPAIFNPYVQKLTEEKTAFLRSGIVAQSPQLNEWLGIGKGGMTLNLPTWKDLDNDAPLIATDGTGGTPPEQQGVLLGGTALVPKKIGTYNEVAIRCTRTQSWAATRLADCLSGSDAMAAIAGRVADYEARFLQRQILAVLKGVFADNVANDSSDMTLNVSGGGFVAGVTNFTAENLFDALQTAGDSQGDFRAIAVHSVVYNRMRKGNLIDFKQDSVPGADLGSFQGLDLIIDDGMPKTGNVYTSYIFAPGALEIGYGQLKKPTAVVEVEDAGNGFGAEVLYRRWQNSVHPMGFAYTGSTTASGGPADSVLEAAASWNRACPERKQVKMAQLITREA